MVKKITIANVLEPFLSRPNEKLHLAQISREIGQPHPTVRQWLNTLENKGVLKKQYQGRLTLYFLNLKNPNIIDYLIISEKNKLIRKCDDWLVLGEIVSYINNNFQEGVKALIFGSATESFDTANDIDMLVIGKTDLNGIRNQAKHLGKEVHIIQVNNLKKVSKALRLEIIKKHIIIKGSEDFMGWMLWQQ